MWQNVITALLVLVAVGYSAWKLMPARWRVGAAQRTGTIARVAGMDAEVAARLQQQAVEAAEAASGCGNCGPCKGCAAKDGEK